jgi:hypothetical protein
LNDLPNELLMHIISNVDPYQSERILGYVPDDPPPFLPDPYLIQDFLASCQPLCSLSLTSKRFRDLAQKHLFFAPVIGGVAFRFPYGTYDSQAEQSHSRIAYFLRTILARPDLRRHVKQIRLCFPRSGEPGIRRCEKEESNLGAEALSSVPDIVTQACGIIDALDLPTRLKESWTQQILMDFRYTMLDVLLGLLPQLERLSFSENSLDTWLFTEGQVFNMFGTLPLAHEDLDLCSIKCLPVIQNLKSLKVSSLTPIRLDGIYMLPSLDTLDLSLSLASMESHNIRHLSRLHSGSQPLMNFKHIRHLRLDCQIKSVGIWDFSARTGITHILQAFSELKSLDFYAEPSSEKNPFRSVRAFPHYQANIQTYPNAPSPTDYDPYTEGTYWDERVYAARTEFTDYQYLVDSLFHIRPHLKILRLPGGFWTLPGASRKPLPRFELFPRLQHLYIPQAALLSIKLHHMRFPETVQGDFELLPTQALPPRLQNLEIFDADAELLKSTWLQELFKIQASSHYWPELQQVKILFGPTFGDLELADLVTRKEWDSFWKLADKAPFKVLVARDDEVPMVRV